MVMVWLELYRAGVVVVVWLWGRGGCGLGVAVG